MKTNAASKTAIATCPKCFGTGRFNCFAHIANGTCFRCQGTGEIEIDGRPLPRAKPFPIHIPNASTPYAVICTDEEARRAGAGGRIGFNLTLSEAHSLRARMAREHGVTYAVVKHIEGAKWSTRDGTTYDL